MQARVDDLETGVAQGARDDLCTAVVTIQAGFRYDDAVLAGHAPESIDGPVGPGCRAAAPVRTIGGAEPETTYAKTADGVHIAYQVVGDGPVDLVFVLGWVSQRRGDLGGPRLRALPRRLASFSRLILFDKRGTGLSDRVPTIGSRPRDSAWTTCAPSWTPSVRSAPPLRRLRRRPDVDPVRRDLSRTHARARPLRLRRRTSRPGRPPTRATTAAVRGSHGARLGHRGVRAGTRSPRGGRRATRTTTRLSRGSRPTCADRRARARRSRSSG